MTPCRPLAVALLLLGTHLIAAAGQPPRQKLLDFSGEGLKQLSPDVNGSRSQVTATLDRDTAPPGIAIAVQPGKVKYPGVALKPRSAVWDLSEFGHVEVRVVNSGRAPATFAARVENDAVWRWNAEEIVLKPQERGTISVIFGYSFNHRPGYHLDSKTVNRILLYTRNVETPRSFRVESIAAAGPAGEKPPFDPAAIRVRPNHGVLLGQGVKLDAKSQLSDKGTIAELAANGQSVEVDFPARGQRSEVRGQTSDNRPPISDLRPFPQVFTLKPSVGRWVLSDATEVRVKLKNVGHAPCTPSVQVFSDGGATDVATASAPLAVGDETVIAASFIPAIPGTGVPVTKPGHFGNILGTGTGFRSDVAAGIKITANHAAEAKLRLESIATAAPPAVLPKWLGKRPPVRGDWVKTFDEEFASARVDNGSWNCYGPNPWDHVSHWSKDNLIVGDGMARLHYEKKHGFHNDNPGRPKFSGPRESDYASGYLDSYGKWAQRYGYFEARMKLVRAPGLWSAFWMMPDRGPGAKDARTDTGGGGMEVDVMEHLARFGPYRYNVALHFDGYGSEHKSVSSACIYVPADKEGFITSGVLWTPGSMVFYGNGREVWRWDDPRVANVPGYFIFDLIAGGWDNDPVDDAKLPADFAIAYVRAWQRKDLMSSER